MIYLRLMRLLVIDGSSETPLTNDYAEQGLLGTGTFPIIDGGAG